MVCLRLVFNMRKLYFIQIITIACSIITMLFTQYTVITQFSDTLPPIDLKDIFIYLMLLLAIFFSLKKKIASSILVIIYSIYFFMGMQSFFRVPIDIFKSLLHGYYQYGFSLLFNLINLILGISIFILWLLKFDSNNDGK